MIVLTLSWLVTITDGKVDDRGLCNTLDDITWVIQCMANMPAMPDPLIGRKRAQNDESDTSMKKRYVLSFPITSQANRVNVTEGKQSELKSGGEIVAGISYIQYTPCACMT